jgi:tetratricopeptide (TPR) repeat protein
MKSALLAILLSGLIPFMLPAQETGWFQKGLETASLRDQITFFTKSIEAGDEVYAAYYCRASARLGTGDVQGAIDDYTKCIELDSTDLDAWYSRGMAKQRISINYQEAVADLAKVFENGSPQAGYIVFFNGFDFKQGNCPAIQEYYQKVLRHFQLDASVSSKLGFCYLALGDFTAAMENFNKSATLQPQRIDPVLGMALACHYQQDTVNAARYLDKAKVLRPALKKGPSGLATLKKEGFIFGEKDHAALEFLLTKQQGKEF